MGALLDSLAGDDDRSWPHENWPAIRFDPGPLHDALIEDALDKAAAELGCRGRRTCWSAYVRALRRAGVRRRRP